MLPTLRDGDRLLVRQGRTPAVGDVVVARFADGIVKVKRVAERRESGWWLLSDNAAEGLLRLPRPGCRARPRRARGRPLPALAAPATPVTRVSPRRTGGVHRVVEVSHRG